MSAQSDFTLTDLEVLRRYEVEDYGIFCAEPSPFRVYYYSYIQRNTAYSFDPFPHTDLICALYQKKYLRAYRLLNALNEPLAPQEAAAACLLALSGTDRLLNTVLDHCPPIPDFQFTGPGAVSSLLVIAAALDLSGKVRILLQRGADPNRGSAERSPLETAFVHTRTASLEELLASPDLEIEITEPMLEEWGWLSPTATKGRAVLRRKCCQLLWDKIKPQDSEPCSPDELPIHPHLRPKHALHHNKIFLAARICEKNPINAEDIDDIVCFWGDIDIPSIHHTHGSDWRKWNYQQDLLRSFLRRFPEYLEHPDIRRLVARAVTVMLEPDEELLSMAAQLADGPVCLHPWSDCGSYTMQSFLPNWQKWLGERLVPAIETQHLTSTWFRLHNNLEQFCHLSVVGSIADEQWAEILSLLLEQIPPEKTALLFAPGRILSHAPSEKLLAMLPRVSAEQRGVILLHCDPVSAPNYDL